MASVPANNGGGGGGMVTVSAPLIFSFIGLGVLALAASLLLYSRRRFVIRDHPYMMSPTLRNLGWIGLMPDPAPVDPPKMWDVHVSETVPPTSTWDMLVPLTVETEASTPTIRAQTNIPNDPPRRPLRRLLSPMTDLPASEPPAVQHLRLAVAVLMPAVDTSSDYPAEFCIGTVRQQRPVDPADTAASS